MKDILDKWCGSIWLYCLYGIGIIMLINMLIRWSGWETPQKVMGIMCVLLPLHVFEENTWPGGFPYMNNRAFGSPEPMICPQNRVTNMWTNLGAELIYIVFLLLTPIFPEALMVNIVVFALMQCVIHTRSGAVMYKLYKDKGKRTIYGPGSITSYIGLAPLAVYALSWLVSSGAEVRDILLGIISILIIVITMILIPFRISYRIRSARFALTDKGCFEKFE